MVIPILTLLIRDQDSFETVRSKAGNAVKNRVCVTSFITSILSLGWFFDAKKIFECSLVIYFTFIGLLVFLAVCICRDVHFFLQLRTSSDPLRLVIKFTKRQLIMDSGYFLVGLPASLIAMLYEKSYDECEYVKSTRDWSLVYQLFACYVSFYCVTLLAIDIWYSAKLLCRRFRNSEQSE